MADEPSPSSTDATSTTQGTTTTAADGSATATGQTNDGGLASALGNGEGLAASAADGTPKEPTSKDNKPPAGAPEKYEAWTVPEGYELDAGLVEEASPIFKDLGLTQEQSQKLVDFYAKHALKSSEEAIAAWTKTRTDWRTSMKSDPELGKLVGRDGNFGPDSPLVSTIDRALVGLQNPKLVSDFKDAMNLTGAGDNPAFVRVLHALAKQVTEGTDYPTGGPAKGNSSRPSAGAAMYPHLPSGS
jgi:hypothetical protein